MGTQRRSFYQLISGLTLSHFGTYLNFIALDMYAYHLTDSALLMGLNKSVMLIGQFATGIYGGILADRYNKKKLMIAADLAQSCFLIILIAVPLSVKLPTLFITSFMLGCFSALFSTSLQASVPDIVEENYRVRANALLANARSISMTAGVFSAGFLVAWLGLSTIFIIDAFTFIISAINIMNIKFPKVIYSKKEHQPPAILIDLKTTINYLKNTPMLLCLLFIRITEGFGSSSHIMGLQIYAPTLNSTNPALILSYVWGSWGVGELIGARLLAKFFKTLSSKRSEVLYLYATIFMGLSFMGIFQQTMVLGLLCFGFLAGLMDGVSLMSYNQRLQNGPSALRGKIFGTSASLIPLGFGIGTLFSSLCLEYYHPRWVVIGFHSLTVMACLVGIYFRSSPTAQNLS